MEKLQTNELFLTKKHVTNNEWQTFLMSYLNIMDYYLILK